MKYTLQHGVTTNIKTLKTKVMNFSVASMFALTSLSGIAPLFLSGTAYADTPVNGVTINEFSSHGSSDWVELYNTTSSPIDLNGWQLRDSTASNIIDNIHQTINGHSYLKLDVGDRLNENGDTITLWHDNNRNTTVTYGTASGAVVAAPDDSQSAARVPNGTGAWRLTYTPTPAQSNNPSLTFTSLLPKSNENYADYVDNYGFQTTFSTVNDDLQLNSFKFTVTPDNSSLQPHIYPEDGGKGGPAGGTFSNDVSLNAIMQDTGMHLGDTFTVTASATDSYGTTATISSDHVQLGVAPDTTPPSTPSLRSPTDGAVVRSNEATLNWSDVTDPEGHGPVTYQYQSSYSKAVNTTDHGFSTVLYGPVSTASNSQIDATHSANNTYYWQVRACDSLHNCSAWSGPWKVTIDSSRPAANNFQIDNQAVAYGTSIKASVTASDNNALKTVGFFITAPEETRNGQPFCTGNGTHVIEATGLYDVATQRYEATLDTSSLNGQYCVSAQAEDAATNHSDIIGRQLVLVDNIAPTINQTMVTTADDTTEAAANSTLRGQVTFHTDQTEAHPNRLYVEYDQLGTDGKWHKLTHTDWVYNTNQADLTVDTQEAADGTYQLKISSDDLAWNHNSNAVTFKVDNTPPKVHVDTPTDNSYSATGSFTITGTASDVISGIDHVNVYVAHDPWSSGGYAVNNQTATYDATTGTFHYSGKGLGEGSYTVKAIAYDKAGNAHFSNTTHLTVDTTRPIVSFTQTPNDFVNGNFDVTATISDASGIDLSSVLLQTEDLGRNARAGKCVAGTLTVTQSSATQATLRCTIDTSGLQEDYTHYVVWVWSKDTAGNSSSNKTGQSEIPFVVDRTNPTVKVELNRSSYTSSGNAVSSSQKPEIEAFDKNLTKIEVLKSDGTFVTQWTNVQQKLTTYKGIGWLSEGAYVIRAYDTAGNVSSDFNITIDNTPPTGTLSYSPSSLTNHSVLVTLKTSEPIQQSSLPGTWLKKSDTEYQKSYPTNTTQPVTLKDLAGNTGSVAVTINWIDKTAPTATISSALQPNQNTVSFNGTVSDPHLKYYYCYLTTNQAVTINGKTYTPGEEVASRDANCQTTWAKGQTNLNGQLGSFDVTSLPSGNYTVNLVVYDLAGNNNVTTPVSFAVTVDHTGPEAGVTSASQTSLNTLSFNGYTFDSNFSHYYCWLTKQGDSSELHDTRGANCITTWAHDLQKNGNPATNYNQGTSDSNSTSPVILGDFDVTGLASGDYLVHLVGVDRLGNQSTEQTFKTTVDHTGPTLPYNGYSQNKNVITPQYSDSDTSDMYQWSADSGNPAGATISDISALNPAFTVTAGGSYKFTLTASDSLGNPTTTLFSFTYLAPTPQAPLQPNTTTPLPTPTSSRDTGFTAVNSQVLGASTVQTGVDTTADDQGHVKGDSIDLTQDAKQKSDTTKNSAAFGLGWWWLVIAGVVVLGFVATLFRRADTRR